MVLDRNRAFTLLRGAEGAYIAAARYALRVQAKVAVTRKSATAVEAVDIVTDADRVAQEMVLRAWLGTDLSYARVWAEEGTKSLAVFVGEAMIRITLDPIDGTAYYAAGKPNFCIIVTAHDFTDLFYTFAYYPAYDFGYRITEKAVETIGAGMFPAGEGTFAAVQGFGGNGKADNSDIARILESEGVAIDEVGADGGPESLELFLADRASHYCVSDPGIEDGMIALHFGRALGKQCWSTVDLSQEIVGPFGPYYPGYYVVRN